MTDVGRAQVVVVGSGPGGAVTACLLAEAGRDVILVEEGEHHGPDEPDHFTREELEAKYRNGGTTVALGRAKISYAEGRCLGGGSEVNSALYHRAPHDVLEEWRRAHRTERIGAEDLSPDFEACERDVGVSVLPYPASKRSQFLAEAAQRAGTEAIEVPRCYRYESRGPDRLQAVRQTMTRTYIPRFLAAGRLLTRVRARKVRRSRGGWVIDAQRLDGRGRAAGAVTLEADAVFVAGGAIQTPALLRRSGFRRNVGSTLRLHTTIKVVAELSDAWSSADVGVGVHQVKAYAPRFSLGCSVSRPEHLALALLDREGPIDLSEEALARHAIYYAMIRGGVGSVRCLPGAADPLVRFELRPEDLVDLAEGLRELCRLLLAGGARVLYPGIRGVPPLRSPADLEKLPASIPPRASSLMTIHLMGSCPMGEDVSTTAVDSYGRVRGVAGLHVADASLFGGALGVNPQGTVMALCRRNALRFLQER